LNLLFKSAVLVSHTINMEKKTREEKDRFFLQNVGTKKIKYNVVFPMSQELQVNY